MAKDCFQILFQNLNLVQSDFITIASQSYLYQNLVLQVGYYFITTVFLLDLNLIPQTYHQNLSSFITTVQLELQIDFD